MQLLKMSDGAQSETGQIPGALIREFQEVRIEDFWHFNRAALHGG